MGFGNFRLSDVRAEGLRRIEVHEPARNTVSPIGWLVQYGAAWQTAAHVGHTNEKPVLDAILRRLI
jgi:hypothetical protein